MPLARVNGRILFFIHIPKTGGSSIEHFLAAHGALALFNTEMLDWHRSSPQHIHADVHRKLVWPKFYDAAFAVMRDPAARLESEYCFRKTMQPDIPSYDDWVVQVFNAHAADPYYLDNHIRPQVEFLRPDTRIFRFEAGLGPVFDWIGRTAGIDPATTEIKREDHGAERQVITPSAATVARIREFYKADLEFLETLDAHGPGPVRLVKDLLRFVS